MYRKPIYIGKQIFVYINRVIALSGTSLIRDFQKLETNMSELVQVSSNFSFGGHQKVFSHQR